MPNRETLTAHLGSESGFALIGALLVMVLVTALGSATIYLARTDLMLAGNYRVQRTAEAAADGALDLVKAMIYGNVPTLNLPLSIPTNGTASTWSQNAAYSDPDIDVSITIKYKQEDSINYYTNDPYPTDEVVRYGKDYNYQDAQKEIGKQPVYTVNFTDNRTGVTAEADLISTIGFTTPAALYCAGSVHMQKYQWATQESIEVIAGSGTPAVATHLSAANITIETVLETTTFSGTTKIDSPSPTVGAATLTVLNSAPYTTAGFPTSGTRRLMFGDRFPEETLSRNLVAYTGVTATQFTGCSGVVAPYAAPPPPPAAPVGTFVNVVSGSGNYNYLASNSSGAGNIPYEVDSTYLHQRVYRPSEVAQSMDAKIEGGKYYRLYDQAREAAHILLGVGDRGANLDAAYLAACSAASGGGDCTAAGDAAGAAAAISLFRFFNAGVDTPTPFDNTVTPHTCSGVVCYGFDMPVPDPTAVPVLTELETMFGQSFAELKSLADQVFTCTSTVSLPSGGSSSKGCNLSGVSLGTDEAPQVVYFNGAASAIALVTDAGTQFSGSGILIIDGDAQIVGSINWEGLMLIRGNLEFKPWQGGSAASRSGRELATTWNGFIIIGGNLDLWTYWGGSIILGYSSNDVAKIKGIISSAVPHKVLSWRRTYD